MKILLDTNILVRAAKASDPLHSTAVAAMNRLVEQGHDLCIVPQNVYELWAVATRPLENGGLGLSIEETRREVSQIRESFELLSDGPELLNYWLELVVIHACKGKPSHDARLIAAMKAHGLNTLLTFNIPDFKRFPDVTILNPAT